LERKIDKQSERLNKHDKEIVMVFKVLKQLILQKIIPAK
jgi:hypothetical protein